MSYITSPGFCFSFREMHKRANLMYQGPRRSELWTDIKESIEATRKFDLEKVQKNLITAYLMEEPTYGVFELSNPYIMVYRWPVTGEYRESLTEDYFIIESPAQTMVLPIYINYQ